MQELFNIIGSVPFVAVICFATGWLFRSILNKIDIEEIKNTRRINKQHAKEFRERKRKNRL